MTKNSLILIVVACLFSVMASAAEFKPYPGAKVDEQATQESLEAAKAAKMTDVQSTIYTTSDSFSSVAAFYKGIGKEYTMPMASGTSGEPKKYGKYDLWEAYFIFDGAEDLAGSKLWVKVQHPFIGEDVRDVTVIVVTEKK
ncbi:MAG: hypothetical protein WBM02_11640 [bacterium]